MPYLEGERTPNLPTATGTLLGLTLASTTRGNLARAAVEGLLGLLSGCLDAVRDQGIPIERVSLVGGAARSAALRELAPGILDIPVDIPEPGEWVAVGAARQAAWVLCGGAEPPAWAVAVGDSGRALRRIGGPARSVAVEQYRRAASDVHRVLQSGPP